LAIGGTVTCTATYTITAADVTAGSVTNTAFGTGAGLTTGNASATVTYAALSISKAASPATYSAVGNTITYTYVLTNSGNTVLGPSQFTVTDNKINGGVPFNCGAPATTLAVGATVTCTAAYTVVSTDITAGSVVNVASGAGDNLITPTVNATVTYVAPPTTTTTTTTLAPTTTTTAPPSLGVIFPATTTTLPQEEFAVLFPLPKTGSDSGQTWWLFGLAILVGGALVLTARRMRRQPE
jgi:LPXTG-motif cell wall-anchored protein